MLPAGEEDEGWAEEELAAAEVDAIDLLFDLSKSQRMGVSGGEAFATRVLRELSSVFSPLSHALSRPSSLAWQLNCTSPASSLSRQYHSYGSQPISCGFGASNASLPLTECSFPTLGLLSGQGH